jgi:hypothetical protein
MHITWQLEIVQGTLENQTYPEHDAPKLTQVVDEEYIVVFDAHQKLWCEQSPIIYEKFYSEKVIIHM